MTNAPETRTTHVIRIAGTNKNGDVLQDIWADLERVDVDKSTTQTLDLNWQGYQRKFRWMDDPASNDFNPDGNPARKTVVVKVCSPDESDVNDPEQWIPVPITLRMKTRTQNYNSPQQGLQDKFIDDLNDELADSRVVEARRIYHYDTNIDADAQAAFDADSTLTAYVVQGVDYTRDDATKDDGQFVDHFVIRHLKHRYNAVTNVNSAGDVRQGRQTKLLNQYLIDESADVPVSAVVGDNGLNPPYRLDPFQNIVNVKFSTLQQVCISINASGGNLENSTAQITQLTKDGILFSDGFGQGTSTAASGFGFTVVTETAAGVATGRPLGGIAFGKPSNGDSCFMLVKNNTLQRGVLDTNGNLAWTTVASFPDTFGINFAGGAFFAYNNSVPSGGGLAVSFDGKNFVLVDPFSTMPSGYQGGSIGTTIVGSVAYNPKNKVYCVTGQFLWVYDFFYIPFDGGDPTHTGAVESNFCWATSSDGINWVARFDLSEGTNGDAITGIINGIGNGGMVTFCPITGQFVAAANLKFSYTNPLTPTSTLTVMSTFAGAAISSDGNNWSINRLPNTDWIPPDPSANLNSSGSGSFSIIYCKDNTPDKGFFVIGATRSRFGLGADGIGGIVEPINMLQLYTSIDGFHWTMTKTVDASNFNGLPNIPWIMSLCSKTINPDKVIKV